MEAEKLIVRAVEKRMREDGSLRKAVELASSALDIDPDRIMRAWFHATTPEQERVLAFLACDHGRYQLHSPLPRHPIYEHLKVRKGDLLASFMDHHIWYVTMEGVYAFVGMNSPA